MHIGEVVMVKEHGSYDHIAWVPSREESGKGDLMGRNSCKSTHANGVLRGAVLPPAVCWWERRNFDLRAAN
jgi:hypothetical protein